MRVQTLQIRNFRLLADVEIALAELTTVIVGRNNSGKTSLSELFRRLASDRTAKFNLEDFSATCFDQFVQCFVDYWSGGESEVIREGLPYIQLRITFSYASEPAEFGPLADLIVDLDPSCTAAVAVVRYQLTDGGIDDLFKEIEPASHSYAETEAAVLSVLRDRIPKLFKRIAWAEDPNDHSNTREIEWSVLERILCMDFVSAQRGLDDITTKDSDSLAKVFEALFVASQAPGEAADRQKIANELEAAVADVEKDLDAAIKAKLELLVPSMQLLGYPGLDGLRMFTETKLDVSRLLTDNTKVRYEGYAGVPLPESYNRLGARNLILMLLRLVGFYRRFAARGEQPGFQLVFIEEPEVHLHPQMQEVFIRQLDTLAKKITEGDSKESVWPVQFVVSTHSSHVANEAPFTSMRYFLCKSERGILERSTRIKDLSQGIGGVPEQDANFLHQYLTLTKCDLFFADKAILVEGTTESLLVPRIVKRMNSEADSKKLASQYLAILEVGGAYAHKFLPLLDFLELPALIITDIDSVGSDSKACAVEDGTHTSNACIKNWFANSSVTVQELHAASLESKTKEKQRIAYQVPEDPDGACGRSFEDAFMLANQAKFGLDAIENSQAGRAAYALAAGVKKAEFALTYATVDTTWDVPRYIRDGLEWLLAVGSHRKVDAGDPLQPVVQEVTS